MSPLPSPITRFEYDFIPIEVTDRQLRSLDRLTQQVGQPVFIRGFNHKNQAGLKATQFVGVFQLDDLTIQVLPKIYRTNGDKAEAAANLLFLLKYAADIPLPTDLTILQNQRSDFLEVLIGLFATHLRSQWQQGRFVPIDQWRMCCQS
jgi:5-methylcytosine-specific restriction enzyme subunit McrC